MSQTQSPTLYRVRIYDAETLDLAEIFQSSQVNAYRHFRRARDAGAAATLHRLTPEASAAEHASGHAVRHEYFAMGEQAAAIRDQAIRLAAPRR
jgi:hypothetical protein